MHTLFHIKLFQSKSIIYFIIIQYHSIQISSYMMKIFEHIEVNIEKNYLDTQYNKNNTILIIMIKNARTECLAVFFKHQCRISIRTNQSIHVKYI